jgi:hypothetical protein
LELLLLCQTDKGLMTVFSLCGELSRGRFIERPLGGIALASKLSD